MKYSVTVEGREHEVQVVGGEVRLDGRKLAAHLVTIPQTPLRQLVLDGTSRTYAILDSDDEWVVLKAGHIRRVSVEDERTKQLRRVTGASVGHDSGGTIKAPMPGLVVRVEVEEGQKVEQGAGVVVLEAMKMENEIRANAGGIVSSIRVEPGQAVEKGSVLVELAPL